VSLRFTNLDQLAACSPAVRAQLEKHLGAPTEVGKHVDAAISKATATQIDQIQGRAHVAKKMGRPEQEAGALLVKWIDLVVMPNGLKPGEFFYHVANGGGRSAVEAGILKGQGVRAGWPDYGLDLPAGPYHGLRLELKADDGAKPPDHQLEILARLESVGYKCCVAWGFDDARRYIGEYLDLYRRTSSAGAEARRPPPAGVPAHE
jgi:hypothetical protein